MAKIYSPNKQYTGISATVSFANGVGETENTDLISWFREKGYEVEGISDGSKQEEVVIEDVTPTADESEEVVIEEEISSKTKKK